MSQNATSEHPESCPCCRAVFKTKEPCRHEWNGEVGLDSNAHCTKCGMSFTAHVFMECP